MYSFELLKKFTFDRVSGTENELKMANIIKDECNRLGASAIIEEFDVDGADISEATLEIDGLDNIECKGVGFSSSTNSDGIKAKFHYVTSYNDALIHDLEGYICLVHTKFANYKLYKLLCEKKVAGLIVCTGSVYLDDSVVDIDPYLYRERHYQNGFIPAVCIRMKDAERILRLEPEYVKIKVIQEHKKVKSHNVVCKVEGSSSKDVVVFSAHYDSVSYSNGVYDNATGSTALFDILAYYLENKPKRTVIFVWCGSEEVGLLGSKNYCAMHKEELDNVRLNINFDMLGVTIGEDCCVVTADNSLLAYVKYYSFIKGFALSSKYGVYPSDSTSFADNGIPSMSFARLAPKGGAEIHSRRDVIDYLSEGNYYRSLDFIIDFSNTLVNSYSMPVEKKIPDNVKSDIDVYFGRKEKA